jgi:hypothetical protein
LISQLCHSRHNICQVNDGKQNPLIWSLSLNSNVLPEPEPQPSRPWATAIIHITSRAIDKGDKITRRWNCPPPCSNRHSGFSADFRDQSLDILHPLIQMSVLSRWVRQSQSLQQKWNFQHANMSLVLIPNFRFGGLITKLGRSKQINCLSLSVQSWIMSQIDSWDPVVSPLAVQTAEIRDPYRSTGSMIHPIQDLPWHDGNN